MRNSAKRIRLAAVLFPAFLFFGCNAPTGLNPPDVVPVRDEPEEVTPGGATAGGSVNADPCFQLAGEELAWIGDHCASTEDPGRMIDAK